MTEPPRLIENGNEVEQELLGAALADQAPSELLAKVLKRPPLTAQIFSFPKSLRLATVALTLSAAAVGVFFMGRAAGPSENIGLVRQDAETAPVQAAGKEGPSARAAAQPDQKNTSAILTGDPCDGAPVAAGSEPRIDWISEGQIHTRESEGRFGTWFVENDGTGIQVPSSAAKWNFEGGEPARLQTSGSRFKTWGASIGVTLAGGGCYNAGVYSGIRFEAKGPSRITVSMQTIDVVPVEEGGTCRSGCYANHRKVVQLTDQLAEYEVQFSTLKQHEYGKESRFDARRLRSVIFQAAPEDTPFEFAISKVKFVKSSGAQ